MFLSKQKPAYELRISDSSSDVCSSDLGFHNVDQNTYFAMIAGYVRHYGLEIDEAEWRPQAIEWSMTRGGRSGRVARSEGRGGGKECVRACRSRGSPCDNTQSIEPR